MWLNDNQLIVFYYKLTPRYNWVSDELTFSASDNDVAPDSSILLENGMWFKNNQLIIFNYKFTFSISWVSDELTFNAFDNNVAPKSPILLQMEFSCKTNQLITFNNKLHIRSNWVSDELTFNASDNDATPDNPNLLQMERDWIIIDYPFSIINSIPGSIAWVMNWLSMLLIRMLLLMNQFCYKWNMIEW